MKIIFTIILVLGMSIFTSSAQNNSYGLSLGIGGGSILKKFLVGGPAFDLNTGYSIGLQYSTKLKNKFHFATGVNWYENSVTISPAFFPGSELTPQTYDVRLIYIPLLFRYDFSKYIFINAGLIADIDISKESNISNQTGAGASIGLGTELSLSNNFSIQIIPYMNFHGLILTNRENFPERILDAGLKLNIMLSH